MEQEILNNIYHLYRGRIINLILYMLFGGFAVLVTIGAIKLEVIESKVRRILLLIAICACAITLPVIEFSTETAPVRADYKESSYIVLENATMTVTTATENFLLRRVNHVSVIDNDGKCYDLMVDSNDLISRGDKYTGTIVYLKHSNYVIWFAFATKQ